MSEINIEETTRQPNFKGIVHLPSKEAFRTLMIKGYLETNAGKIIYSPLDTIYTTPDNIDEQLSDMNERVTSVEDSLGAIDTALEKILGV